LENSPYTILLVDDQVIETRIIRKVIQDHGLPLQISTASNGEEALEMLRLEKFDILFTDIKMPRMNGLDLARHARTLNAQIQLIIYSAFGEFEYAKEAIGLGAIHYLLKPLDIAEFLGVMDKAITLCKQVREVGEKDREEKASRYALASESERTPDDNVRKVIQDIKQIVRHELGNPDLNVDYLASKVFLSSSYLGHLFKLHMNENLGKYIIRVRMEQAKRLLVTTHLKISEIGQQVGYFNPSYFSMLFKSNYGCTPVQFREKGESD